NNNILFTTTSGGGNRIGLGTVNPVAQMEIHNKENTWFNQALGMRILQPQSFFGSTQVVARVLVVDQQIYAAYNIGITVTSENGSLTNQGVLSLTYGGLNTATGISGRAYNNLQTNIGLEGVADSDLQNTFSSYGVKTDARNGAYNYGGYFSAHSNVNTFESI